MSTCTKRFNLFLSSIIGIIILSSFSASAAGVITLYTPYTNISVPPGESIDYTIDVINNSSEVRNIKISMAGLPKDWDYTLKSGGWNIGKISVLPGKKESLKLRVNVPLRIEKGKYRFRLVAGGYTSLPLEVVVSQKGTFKTEFTTEQPNMEGHAKSTFIYKASLQNRTADKQQYALKADAPRGWKVTFKVQHKNATSANIDANSTEDISIEMTPPQQVKAGKYEIPVSASTSSTSAHLELEAVVTGTYDMELTTPNGLLSTDITAGKEKRVELQVRNTGSADLTDIKLSASKPANWDVTFDPENITRLGSGESTYVYATIKADKKAIPGDYVTTLHSRTPEASSNASFRVTVKTGMLWGWIGILVILIAMAGVFYLFRKYGRR
jgi:uncharacterized membrane protein